MLKYLNMTTAATFFIGHHSDYSSILLWPDSKQTRQCGQLILVFVSGFQRLFGHQQPIRHDMAEVCYVSVAFLLFVSDLIPLHYFSEPNPYVNYHNRLLRGFRRGPWSFLSSLHLFHHRTVSLHVLVWSGTTPCLSDNFYVVWLNLYLGIISCEHLYSCHSRTCSGITFPHCLVPRDSQARPPSNVRIRRQRKAISMDDHARQRLQKGIGPCPQAKYAGK